MSNNKTEITFKTFDGVTLLDAEEVQKAIQAIHSNFEIAMQQIANERDELIIEVEKLRGAVNAC